MGKRLPCPEREPCQREMMNRKLFRMVCLTLSVAILGFAILYGSGDNGNLILWGIMVAFSLIGIFWGLMGFKKSN